ncbi:EC protein I/II [Brachypodium distachyon]|uniref:Uncharacterized protein n=1 Tax=Brachypodium distachyon TaxID=15368 RepID=A0A0Q3JHH0_BRADI|nr:EC protein I/II [Brachypodium distachyon]KQJ97624.1 hypothetical protein BRADI_3g32279v3 [Brachypodium distachyon]|eukprot:XP_003572023.1 EC protein I/II [Brachypodium distachyon]
MGGCDDKCGCAVPCPGGATCRCTRSGAGASAGQQHTTCGCGEHCGCNPCACGREGTPSGRANRTATCSCGAACDCASCRSSSTA